MIFAGGPGVGKTACAIAMARDLYGDNIGRIKRAQCIGSSGHRCHKRNGKGICKDNLNMQRST
jgi:DNA replication protein DnaC